VPDAESGTDAAQKAEAVHGNTMEFTPDGLVATVDGKSLTRIKKKFEKLAKKANSLKINPPQLTVETLETIPVRHRITFSFQPPQIGDWTLIAVLHHEGGRTEVHPMEGVEVPEQYHHAASDCDHCRTKQRRKDTFILENEARELKQVGRTCLKDFFGGLNPEALIYFSDAIVSLKEDIAELKVEEPAIGLPEADAFEDVLADDIPVDDEPAGEPETPAGFRAPGGAASVPEVLKFLLDRTGYIKQLELENTPDSLARTDNLRELVNAAMDSRDRGETLAEFLDHAALVSDVDTYDPRGQVTLMTLHSAKGLEFNLVLLVGLEEGLFPHSRTFNDAAQMEEERRLCYVGMTRAMDQLILTRADFRRRYGTENPEASTPSRFLEEVPGHLLENIGTPRASRSSYQSPSDDFGDSHYNYEDEDQSVRPGQAARAGKARTGGSSGPKYNSIDNIADFFASRGKKFNLPKALKEEPSGKGGFKPGQRVKHPKYGEGVVYQREGEGETAKITVQFPRFGIKKLVEKYAQLEKA
jgi:hypothetical protein